MLNSLGGVHGPVVVDLSVRDTKDWDPYHMFSITKLEDVQGGEQCHLGNQDVKMFV